MTGMWFIDMNIIKKMWITTKLFFLDISAPDVLPKDLPQLHCQVWDIMTNPKESIYLIPHGASLLRYCLHLKQPLSIVLMEQEGHEDIMSDNAVLNW